MSMGSHPRPPDHPTAPAQPAIHAPWRQEYLESLGNPSAGPSPVQGSGSFLRDYWLSPGDDVRNLVVARTATGMILLNRYPYTGGHLLVALGEPRPRLLDYTAAQRADLWSLVDRAAELLERTLGPQGINIGVNQGVAAGAGVPQHLHVHLVPRWGGDVNFMAVVGNIRVISSSLERMAERFRAAWQPAPAAPP